MHEILRLLRLTLPTVVIGVCLIGAEVGHAQKKKDDVVSTVLARTRSALGTIFATGKTGEARSLELYSDVPAGTRLFSPPGQRGVLDVQEGDLRLTLVGNAPEISPSPVLETTITLAPSKDYAAEVALEQGILLIEAGKESAGGKIRVKIRDKYIGLTLAKASAVAFELFRYLPEGTRPSKTAKVEPVAELLFYVLRGKVDAAFESENQVLNGPVLFHWTSRSGLQGPLAVRKMPEWASMSKIGAEELAFLKAAEKIRRASEKNSNAWQELLKSKEAIDRVAAVYHAAALDRVGAIVDTLNSDPNSKVRQAAITALRVYSSNGSDSLENLQKALIEHKFKPGQAAIFLHLMSGFTPGERNRPEIYESLISYLGHDLQAIRQLAGEQLAILVPAGKDIAYDAAAAPEAREKAQTAWRKLIPRGSLPKVEK